MTTQSTPGPEFKVGDRVTFNGGFPGVVIQLYSLGMIVVRGERGSVCIPVEDAKAAK